MDLSRERRAFLFYSGPTLGLPLAYGANREQSILTVLAVPDPTNPRSACLQRGRSSRGLAGSRTGWQRPRR